MSLTPEAIMAERGVGRRRALQIIRRERQREYDKMPATDSQRSRLLRVLYREGPFPDVPSLVTALDDPHFDSHDTVKTLWSLQKSAFVSFRERNGGLERIALTAQGKSYAANLSAHAEIVAQAALDGPREVEAVVTPKQPEMDAYEATVPAHLRTDEVSLSDFPLLSDLVERDRKMAAVSAAAQLLDDAGVDDLAIMLYERITFDPLEREIVSYLRTTGVIP